MSTIDWRILPAEAGGRLRRVSIALVAIHVMAIYGALAAGPAQAASVDEVAYAQLNQFLVERHALPRFGRMHRSAAGLRQAGQDFCRSRTKAGLEAARRHFHATVDAWMGVQHLRFGPAELFSRFDRLYFWPQARGKVGAAVDKLLADGGIPAPDHMTTASAAIQGLPALEYLLFVRAETLLGSGGKAERACDLLRAVTRNIDGIAAGLAADWSGGRVDFRRAIGRPGAASLYYKSHKEVTLAFFQSLHDGLQAITDTRVKPVLGATLAAARPRLAEAIPSRRSTRNIAVSLAALEALYIGEGQDKDTAGFARLVRSHGHAKLDALMRRAFQLTLATARGIGKPLDVAVRDRNLRPRVAKLLLQVRALKQIVRTRLAPAIGLTVGFNALDGD